MSLDFTYLGLGAELIDYRRAWDLQRALHAEVVSGARPDTVLILEHAGVYTAGKRTEPGDRPIDGTPVVEVDRGGKITWHGPGQLVGYPIVRLPEPIGVVDYVRRLEEAMIRAFADLGLAHGPGGRAIRSLARSRSFDRLRTTAQRLGRNARSPPSASGSRPGSPCTASPSTSIPTSGGSTRSCPAASPTPGSPRWPPNWTIRPSPCIPWRTCSAPTSRTCSASPRTRSRRICTAAAQPAVSYGITV